MKIDSVLNNILLNEWICDFWVWEWNLKKNCNWIVWVWV